MLFVHHQLDTALKQDADDEWRLAHGYKTEAEEYLEEYKEYLEKHDYDDEPPWQKLGRWLEALEHERTASIAPTPDDLENMSSFLVEFAKSGDDVKFELPPFPDFKALVVEAHEDVRARIVFAQTLPEAMDDDEYYDRLTELLQTLFGDDISPPSDPEERDKYDFAKMGLERQIARVARDPDTLNKVADKFYSFADLRIKTENKYRRTIGRFVAEIGDIPVGQVTAIMLRKYREKLKTRKLLPSSIRAEFTPLMGLFNYAVDEGLLELSPMVGVKLPPERRSVEEMKWLPFKTEEMERILIALDEVWGQRVLGLTDERRQALQMAVRVLAYTAMRPSEFMALRPDQVDERAIRVEGGKTKSSWRVIPLHPKIADFPAWLHAGGINTFNNRKTGKKQTDTVTILRDNFKKLICKKMTQPIIHNRKVLYSLRSTFQNAMRRAGAPKDVRRAILGHVESGAMRHYDDGPEFEILKKWVECSDPRR